MQSVKLTLSADKDLVRHAKRLAAARHTSISALFARFVRGLTDLDSGEPESWGPVTRRAAGLVRLPRCATDRALLEDALAEEYGR